MHCGVGVIEFWDYTLAELNLILQNYRETEEMKARERIALSYNLAHMTANFVSLSFSGKPIPSFDETFPSLKEASMTEEEKKELEYKQAMFLKEQMEFAAKAHNAKRAKSGGDGLSH